MVSDTSPVLQNLLSLRPFQVVVLERGRHAIRNWRRAPAEFLSVRTQAQHVGGGCHYFVALLKVTDIDSNHVPTARSR
jgi:hypothetical protein